MPRVSKSARQYSQVEESLAKDPEFVKAGFHIGRFITAVVDIEKDHANMDALYNDMVSASARLNVSISYPMLYNFFCLIFTTLCYAGPGGAFSLKGSILESHNKKTH
jgi:hypothetical protein